jgi:hypothetical protein
MNIAGTNDTDPVVNKITEYINQLSPMQQKAYNIAKQHLGTSFNISKSNGFIDWLKEQNAQQNR